MSKPPTSPPGQKKVSFGKVEITSGKRIVIYGPGGIGKTTLASKLPGKTAIFDFEDSLSTLKPKLDESGVTENLFPVQAASWSEMRDAINSPGWEGINNIIIDSGTKAEELLIAHILATVRHENGQKVDRLEEYGFGKHVRIIYESFLPLLDDLDKHKQAGRNIVIIGHECTSTVPNPEGNDWLRYEPRFFAGSKKGENSIRARVKEWSDYLLFFGYDVSVAADKQGKGNKAKGSGTRTIYRAEMPFCMAKSRGDDSQIQVNSDTDVWTEILK